MAVATATAAGKPSVRFVLLKQADSRGFVFYTNTRSRKGRELRANPHASLVFYWDKAGKQVRVDGRVVRVSDREADAYWATRPRASQIGGIASEQSAPLTSRLKLLGKIARVAIKYVGGPVPRPSWWTGYRVIPNSIEFWTRRLHRVHERVLFTRARDRRGRWTHIALQP